MVITKTLLRKGEEHKIFCQDFFYNQEFDDIIISAVFDGCSNQENESYRDESQFISNLSAKIFKSICPTIINDFQQIDPKLILYNIITRYFNELKFFRDYLNLCEDELLTTVLLCVYNKSSDSGHIISLGDGYVSVNGDIKDILNGKKTDLNPDGGVEYPIQFLDKYTVSDHVLSEFLKNFKDQWSFENLKDVVISTDGITSWELKNPDKNTIKSATDFLANDNMFYKQPIMLDRKFNQLIYNGWRNKDDVGIIRLIKLEDDILPIE